MGRLTRAQTQERNRAKVLAAARDEFAERGFRAAKIDAIAERAGFTRGAVYSNFPGKRALYFAVLADLVEREPAAAQPEEDPAGALGALARAWLARLPLVSDDRHGRARLGMDLIPEIIADERTRQPYAQLLKLDAILLGLALENLRPAGAPARDMTRVAEAVLTNLHGATQLAAAAPGFVEPFDVVTVCRRLADLDLGSGLSPVPVDVPPARPADEPWSPPEALDLVRGEPAPLAADGVVAILGLHRLEAVEEAVRAAPPGTGVTAVVVTGDPGELAPLARLVLAELCGPLRGSFPVAAWPEPRVVLDESGAVAAAAGAPGVGDGTETAVLVRGGRVVARAHGRGACHAVAVQASNGPAALNRPGGTTRPHSA